MKEMSKSEIIIGMLDLMDSPEKWTRNASARDKDDKAAACEGSQAVSWCLGGAFSRIIMCNAGTLNSACPEWAQQAMGFLNLRARAEYGIASLPDINDNKLVDYEDMRMFLKRALIQAEELEEEE